MSSKFLIIGKSGQVASCLRDLMPQAKFIGAHDWILSESGVKRALDQVMPRVIVNAAAYTAVDKAESEKDLAVLLNATLPKWLANWAKQNESILVHYSTDYVYDGHSLDPHEESEAMKPLNFYGHSKALGDEAIIDSCAHALILRISWVYSKYGSNFLKTMVRLGLEKDVLCVVADQIGCPTSAHQVADATIKCVREFENSQTVGIFNFAPLGFLSWYQFADEIFKDYRSLKNDLKLCDLKPIESKDYSTLAVRPLNSRLNCNKFDQAFEIKRPYWRLGLSEVMRQLYGS